MMHAPFQYFGGKRMIADQCWELFGRVDNYVEPFFGSGAVLLAAPYIPRTETVSDMCAFISNFWRAVQWHADELAELLNWPVNECDLEARHKFLCTQPAKSEFEQRVKNEYDYCDVQRAAYWCWGLCAWIGSGWCEGEWYGPDSEQNSGRGINVRDLERGGKRPHLGNAGRGVHKQRPHLGDAGRGVHKQRPHLGDAGRGVHKQRPHLGNAGQGECDRRLSVLVDWMRALQDRLRNVRVCCGDWSRVCTPTPTVKMGTTAVFLDPPYSGEAGRDNAIYREENLSVAHDVRAWCLERGGDKRLRIILCGYEGEHNELEEHGWQVIEWKASGGMASTGSNGDVNRHRERLWVSPHCVGQGRLF